MFHQFYVFSAEYQGPVMIQAVLILQCQSLQKQNGIKWCMTGLFECLQLMEFSNNDRMLHVY